MVSLEKAASFSKAGRGPVLLMDWAVAGITPPNLPKPVPETPPQIPPDIPDSKEPLGVPGPIESPVPVREPPITLPPQS